jgi:hypothetical protein
MVASFIFSLLLLLFPSFCSSWISYLFPISWDRAEPGTSDLDTVLREIYVLYSDCTLVRKRMMMLLRLYACMCVNIPFAHLLLFI